MNPQKPPAGPPAKAPAAPKPTIVAHATALLKEFNEAEKAELKRRMDIVDGKFIDPATKRALEKAQAIVQARVSRFDVDAFMQEVANERTQRQQTSSSATVKPSGSDSLRTLMATKLETPGLSVIGSPTPGITRERVHKRKVAEYEINNSIRAKSPRTGGTLYSAGPQYNEEKQSAVPQFNEEGLLEYDAHQHESRQSEDEKSPWRGWNSPIESIEDPGLQLTRPELRTALSPVGSRGRGRGSLRVQVGGNAMMRQNFGYIQSNSSGGHDSYGAVNPMRTGSMSEEGVENPGSHVMPRAARQDAYGYDVSAPQTPQRDDLMQELKFPVALWIPGEKGGKWVLGKDAPPSLVNFLHDGLYNQVSTAADKKTRFENMGDRQNQCVAAYVINRPSSKASRVANAPTVACKRCCPDPSVGRGKNRNHHPCAIKVKLDGIMTMGFLPTDEKLREGRKWEQRGFWVYGY